jgi:predicted hydrolase (HD superfamily)
MLHDFDYEMFPTADEHPSKGANILCGRGYPDRVIRAILGHATYTGVPRQTLMAKVLFAVDELTGLITATALVKPSKSVHEVDAKSVRKKMKDKAFARGVSREDVIRGAQELGVDLDEHIQFVIDALRRSAEPLGLAGTPSGG